MKLPRGRLLFLAGDFPPDVGGIQRYSYELIRAVAELGVSCVAVAPRRGGAAALDEALPFPLLGVGGGSKPVLAWRMSRAVKAVARTGTIAAIVATKWMPEGPAYLLAGGARFGPLVLVGYGREFFPEPNRALRGWLQRRVLRASTLCFAVSHFTAQNFQAAGVPASRVRVIYGGVNYRNFQGREKEGERIREKLGLGSAPLLLTVSRLVKRKGHDLVMKALAQIRPRFPQARYAVVGDGPEREALFSLAQRLGLSEHVIFAGSVPDHDLPAWYAACDVFVMPSRDIAGQPPEGLGLVYLEANAAGKPVIGARTGGVPDAIVHEQTGLLVDPEDVKALAAAIQRLIEHPAEAGRMGETGRQRVLREFTWHAVAERFLSALSETLSDKWQYP